MLLRLLALIGVILASPVCASAEQQLEVRLVVAAEGMPQPERDELDLFMPRFTECANCEKIRFSPPGGGSSVVEAERAPRLILASSDIKEVRLIEARSFFDPNIRSWLAIAIPTDEARSRMAELTRSFPFDSVLVTISGTHVDVHNTATWSRGIRLGVFRSRNQLTKFAESLEPRSVWSEFDEEEFENTKNDASEILKSVTFPESPQNIDLDTLGVD